MAKRLSVTKLVAIPPEKRPEWKYTKQGHVNLSVGASSLQVGEGTMSLKIKT